MYNTINKTSGIYPNCKEMDIHLTNLGYTNKSLQSLLNPCEQHSAYLLHDVEETAETLLNASKTKEKVVIIGDYDADGVTSTSIMYLTLGHAGVNVSYIVPHRIHDGYGLSQKLVDKAIEDNADIILTVDNGIAAHDAVDYAKSKGLKVIITDHHEIQGSTPNADYIVHPGLGEYPFRDISGCQVAYKLSQVILDKKPKPRLVSARYKRVEQELKDYLFQLSTISIVSDVMPIASADEEIMKVNENRKWLMDGLKSIQEQPNWRLACLLDSMNIKKEVVDEQTIGFYIAPTINSAGRLNDATDAVCFLTARDESECMYYMSFIMYLNEERKSLKKDCMDKISIDESDKVHIICQKDIHEGIIGILAGQISNTTHQPAFVMTDAEVDGKKAWKGSARGNGTVNLFQILETIQNEKDLLYAFGGHADAAGLTVLDSDLEDFKEALKEQIDKYDTEVQSDVINIWSPEQKDELAKAVYALKPFGNGLPLPVFKQSLSIKTLDFFYKSGHVKATCWEKKGGKFISTEIWLFNKLEQIKNDHGYMDKLSITGDNVDSLLMKGITPEEVDAIKMETYTRKKGKTLKRNFIMELGYTAFNNVVGPNYNLIDIYE